MFFSFVERRNHIGYGVAPKRSLTLSLKGSKDAFESELHKGTERERSSV